MFPTNDTHFTRGNNGPEDEDVMSWCNDLRRIGTNCAFGDITTDEIYRDHLVSSVRDERVRDRLLEQRELTLEKALDIIRSSEIKAEQAKAWNSIGDTDVHMMRKGTRTKQWGKHGNEAERPRPRETTRATIGIVVNCSFCGKTIEANVQLGEGNAESVRD